MVNESGTLIAAAGEGVIATKAVGTSFSTTHEAINASLSVPTAPGRRLNLNSKEDKCSHVDFDPVFNAERLKGTLTQQQCINGHQDAKNGGSVSITSTNTESGVQETHRILTATSLYETLLDGCEFVKIIVAQDKNWYFRSCHADACEWFETTESTKKLDLFEGHCCLQSFNDMKDLGE
jgi:hypothetical protein